MQDILLYRFNREGGGITISTEKPKTDEYTTLHRLVADEGMLLTDGEKQVYCVDTENTVDWSEIVNPNPIEEGEEDELNQT